MMQKENVEREYAIAVISGYEILKRAVQSMGIKVKFLADAPARMSPIDRGADAKELTCESH
jgi:hypothetical protein